MASENKTYELVVEPRTTQGKAVKQLRRQAILPAVVYGSNVEPQAVQLPLREFERVYLRVGNTSLVDLKIGDAAPRKAFIYKVDRNPISHAPAHVDLMIVNLRQEMTLNVPLVLVGESPAVAAKEGVLVTGVDHVQIRALPTDVPPLIEVDISHLAEIDQTIHVSDLTMPGNITLLTDPEEMVAKVTVQKITAEEAAEDAAAEAAEEAGAAESGGGAGSDKDES